MEVLAKCVCNGHDTACQASSPEEQYSCVCDPLSHTAGKHCEICEYMYNQYHYTTGQACQGKEFLRYTVYDDFLDSED